jgi:hypothetical protein
MEPQKAIFSRKFKKKKKEKCSLEHLGTLDFA